MRRVHVVGGDRPACTRVRDPRTWRGSILAAVAVFGLAGCASSPAPTQASPAVVSPVVPACDPPVGPVVRPTWCALPADVRAFVDDRDGCDHFRGEPWPEGNSDDDRERRQQLVDAVRRLCAGTDRRLDALLKLHRDNPEAMRVLAAYERNIESGP